MILFCLYSYNKKTQKLFSLETSKQHDKALKDLQKYQDDAKRAINVLNEVCPTLF
jgi:hypothetical protein